MLMIKRYPNRKYYNTRDKSYITLEQLAKHINNGEEIQVIDYASGEDLTSLTLSQIILELEKSKIGSLPRNILANIIRFTAESTPLKGIFSLDNVNSEALDEEIRKRILFLESVKVIDKEEAVKIEKWLIEDYHSLASIMEDELTQRIEEALLRRALPTRIQLEQIKKKLENLAQEVENIVNQQVQN
jgi:polyhydroxyalkanoate synthesis repressor PhaR